MTRMRFKVRGRVQGVGFRAYAVRLAKDCGVVGWVRNDADGSVTAEAAGSEAELLSFAAGLRMGPPAARVERVEAVVLDDVERMETSEFAVED